MEIARLRRDLSPEGFPRRLGYELRIAWDPDAAELGSRPEPVVLRQLLTVNGRAARAQHEPECMDPRSVSPEPLMMLLPARRADYEFTRAGRGRVDGRDAEVISFESLHAGVPEIEWRDDCVSLDLPGRWRGRVWIDTETYDVLRLDEHLVGMFDFNVPIEQQRLGGPRTMTLERATSSIRYRRVEFENPTEQLTLPAEIETLTVFRGGVTRLSRIRQRFSDHRRFLADARVLP